MIDRSAGQIRALLRHDQVVIVTDVRCLGRVFRVFIMASIYTAYMRWLFFIGFCLSKSPIVLSCPARPRMYIASCTPGLCHIHMGVLLVLGHAIGEFRRASPGVEVS